MRCRVELEPHPLREPVLDDAGDLVEVLVDPRLALDHRGDREHLVALLDRHAGGIERLEGAIHELLQDVVRRQAGLELVGRREQVALEAHGVGRQSERSEVGGSRLEVFDRDLGARAQPLVDRRAA